MRTPRLKALLLFICALTVQLALLQHEPSFARTFDLLLLFLAALAVSQEPLLVIIYAAVAGITCDSLTVSHTLMFTFFYIGSSTFIALRKPYVFLNNPFPFVATVAALSSANIIFDYIWTVIFVQPVSPALLVHINWPGLAFIIAFAWLAAKRLMLMLKDPEVLDFEVRR